MFPSCSLYCFLNLCLMLIHEHPQDGVDDMLGRYGLATSEVEGLNLMVQPLSIHACDSANLPALEGDAACHKADKLSEGSDTPEAAGALAALFGFGDVLPLAAFGTVFALEVVFANGVVDELSLTSLDPSPRLRFATSDSDLSFSSQVISGIGSACGLTRFLHLSFFGFDSSADLYHDGAGASLACLSNS